MGTIMFIGGILGVMICIVILCLLPKIFAKKKKLLYEQFEQDE